MASKVSSFTKRIVRRIDPNGYRRQKCGAKAISGSCTIASRTICLHSCGLQVYVPLNTAITYEETNDLSRTLAQHLEHDHADRVPSNMSKAVRKGKVLVDWSQNDEHKTTVCVYSLRAKEEPPVSTPVTWSEVENCLKKKKSELLKFRSDQVLARVEKLGDLFEPVEKIKQKLPKKW